MTEHFKLITVSLLSFEIIYCAYIWTRFHNTGNNEQIIDRMTAYADLKSNNCDDKCAHKMNGSKLMSSGAHEVLLGTLKKVEAKNSALIAIIVFAVAILMGSILSDKPDLDDGLKKLMVVFVTLLILPTLASFRGIRQIDQIDFPCRGIADEQNSKVRLETHLLRDLIGKERAFRFALVTTKCTVTGLMVIVVLDEILSSIGVTK
ncbi:hypothetical protein A9Q96_15570 [Rhodobacterales bacterium 52_120_T64]|nr:hypothetical protein A9Q96_15570 [Rhodobacterales bacterium 52_120_T64]